MRPGHAALNYLAALALATAAIACQGAATPPANPDPPDDGEGGSAAGAGGSGGSKAPAADSGAPRGGEGGRGGAGGSGGETSPPDAAASRDLGTSPDLGATGDTATEPPAAGPRESEACGKGGPVPAEGFHTLTVGSRQRRFFLRIPAGYDGKKAWPVIFGFHGAGNKDGSWFDTHTGLRRENEADAVMVFGESLYRPGSTSERSWQDEGQLPDNLAYIDATVAWLKKNVCVDPLRLFAAGQSSGAYFSQTLGCHRGDVFRAVASSDGGERLFADCRGNPGAFVRYRPGSAGGGADSLRVLDFWTKRYQCSATKSPTMTPPCQAFQGCQNDTHVWACADGGAHDWPAYMDRGVWNFFSLFK